MQVDFRVKSLSLYVGVGGLVFGGFTGVLDGLLWTHLGFVVISP